MIAVGVLRSQVLARVVSHTNPNSLLPYLFLRPSTSHGGSAFLSQSSRLLSSSSKGIPEVDPNAEAEFAGEVKDILEEYEFRRKRHGSLLGLVVSQKCAKSVTVRVEHQKLYPKYNAVLTSRKKIMAHDETEVGEVGDLVRIVPCRPMSRKKRFKVMDVLRKARRLDDSVRSPAAAAVIAAGGKMLGVGDYSLATKK